MRHGHLGARASSCDPGGSIAGARRRHGGNVARDGGRRHCGSRIDGVMQGDGGKTGSGITRGRLVAAFCRNFVPVFGHMRTCAASPMPTGKTSAYNRMKMGLLCIDGFRGKKPAKSSNGSFVDRRWDVGCELATALGRDMTGAQGRGRHQVAAPACMHFVRLADCAPSARSRPRAGPPPRSRRSRGAARRPRSPGSRRAPRPPTRRSASTAARTRRWSTRASSN